MHWTFRLKPDEPIIQTLCDMLIMTPPRCPVPSG
jgi:hypothetical protein